MTAQLFQPIALGGLTVSNRIVVAPMCQYAAVEGVMQPWHIQQIGSQAASGFGLVILEATGVEAIGRISPACPGLWNDEQESVLKSLVDGIRTYSDAKLGIQLAHAGRKASTEEPWKGHGYVTPENGGWQTLGPSPISFNGTWPAPKEATSEDIQRVIKAFGDAAKRSDRAGLDLIEIHATHGYLLHEFFSPLSNKRTDTYGGSFENRVRLILEVVAAVRANFPKEKAVGIRIAGSDWDEGGVTPDEAVKLSVLLKDAGIDFIHVSSGGLSSTQKITVGPNYQVHFAEVVRKAVPGVPVMAVGMIVTPTQAEQILEDGQADMIALARAVLDEPRWVWRAAEELGVTDFHVHPRFARATPKTWPGYKLKAGLAQAAE
jgi:2,4-dienoyl-CoA reductase-like NADH-dependent reductase (Old Yellow Enzyme family)